MDISFLRDKFLDFYNPLRTEFYKELEGKGIIHLSQEGATDDLKVGNFIEVVRSKQHVQQLPYSEFMIYDELDFVLQDLKYIIGILSVMQPYINHPLREDGTYYQTLEDHQYLRYSSFGFQSVYEFWDRLGDLLYLYFQTGLKAADVYFPRMLRDIKEPYRSTPQFVALETFYNNQVKGVLDTRHGIVHHYLLKGKARWDHIQHFGDPKELKKDYEEKMGYKEILITQALNCLEGYRLSLGLLGVLPDKV